MGRHQKYIGGTESVCLSLPTELLERIDHHSRDLKITRSEFLTTLLISRAVTEFEYASFKAREYYSMGNYWKSIKDQIEMGLKEEKE